MVEAHRAERARTVLVHAPMIAVEVGRSVIEMLDVRAVDVDGTVVLLVPTDGELVERLAGGPAPCVLRAALVSPLACPDRILDEVTVLGRLRIADDVEWAVGVVADAHPARALLKPATSTLLSLEVVRVLVDGRPVNLDAYVYADADPLAESSDDYVRHLVHRHPQQLIELAHLLEPAMLDSVLLDTAAMIAPVRIDRRGLTMEVAGAGGRARGRLDFADALHSADDLPAAMRELQARASRAVCSFTGESPRRRPEPNRILEQEM